METSLYEITFKDGRVFRVFCANKAQKERFKKSYLVNNFFGKQAQYKQISNGIHTIKQWEDIIDSELKNK